MSESDVTSSRNAASARLSPITSDVFCQKCKYNLRGLTGNRCPECGCNITLARLQTPEIPWARRREMGWIRAYWKTVWWSHSRHKRDCEEIATRANYRDSQIFRWITIAHVFAAAAAVAIMLYATHWISWFFTPSFADMFSRVWPASLLLVATIPLLTVMTGVTSYFFEVRDAPMQQRNRAIAMSYYCCGVLAWLPGPALLLVIAPLTESHSDETPVAFQRLAFIWIIGLMLIWWLDVIRTVRRVLPSRPRRVVVTALLLPLAWLGCVVLILGVLPIIAVSLYLLMTAFR